MHKAEKSFGTLCLSKAGYETKTILSIFAELAFAWTNQKTLIIGKPEV